MAPPHPDDRSNTQVAEGVRKATSYGFRQPPAAGSSAQAVSLCKASPFSQAIHGHHDITHQRNVPTSTATWSCAASQFLREGPSISTAVHSRVTALVCACQAWVQLLIWPALAQGKVGISVYPERDQQVHWVALIYRPQARHVLLHRRRPRVTILVSAGLIWCICS